MDSITATKNFLQALDNAVNDNLEKAAEKKGIAVQELIMVFQESGWQKDAHNNQMNETIHEKRDRSTTVSENNVDKPVYLSVPN
ncbi:hypothetical protein HY212_00520 [Candidatus Pacearchaeota archaeon]|nr:hypothetical protein [Candidatus Pacearchaeota archaeon]